MEVFIEQAEEMYFEGPDNPQEFAELILKLTNMKSNDSSIVELRTFYGTNEIKVIQLMEGRTYSPERVIHSHNGITLEIRDIEIGAVPLLELMDQHDGVYHYFIAQ